ncbi:putative pyrazinamidase/nicotinamidase [Fictibacillus macauensis ZFHKF-1]|uniref:Putative pyrazinamidase/nicotinamidase n=1 Tax=Fictibacillus macauensis ZFHKF-1 TaxID=1196324 RepID=I8UIV2_9BACL|nr:isochorismatase family cysteine hydrolase [Fictibacillus macauensis]EIT86820.1 putative pyrazinamidase/nicotinamidase [Fictibacillus macauensis ZFHKF-1]
MRALLVIDYTYDFVADDGKLTTGKHGQYIDEAISKLIMQFAERGDYIVFAVDRHELSDPFHPESKLYPPHNIVGTKGRSLYGKVGFLYEELLRNNYPYVTYMDKTRYSAFAGTPLDIKLRERRITTITLTGVTTDICVLQTGIDGYNLCYDMIVPAQAVQSFTQEGQRFALQYFKTVLGATVLM